LVQTKIDLDGEIHRKLKAAAALKGFTLKNYIQEVLRREANEGKSW